jgi:acyl carrier protein
MAEISQTTAEITDWLVQRLAKVAKVPPSQIDINEPFARYGLDSRQAVQLSGDLEDWLKAPLVPTLVWDYPSIAVLADHLGNT